MKKKRINKTSPALIAALSRLTPAQLIAAHRIAKDHTRGLTPLFTSPHAMIALRDAAYNQTSTFGSKHEN